MLGTRIETRMAELGIKTQTELARRAQISPSSAHALIRGTRGKRLSITMVQKLSKALRVPQKFFFEEDTKIEKMGEPSAHKQSQSGAAPS